MYCTIAYCINTGYFSPVQVMGLFIWLWTLYYLRKNFSLHRLFKKPHPIANLSVLPDASTSVISLHTKKSFRKASEASTEFWKARVILKTINRQLQISKATLSRVWPIFEANHVSLASGGCVAIQDSPAVQRTMKRAIHLSPIYSQYIIINTSIFFTCFVNYSVFFGFLCTRSHVFFVASYNLNFEIWFFDDVHSAWLNKSKFYAGHRKFKLLYSFKEWLYRKTVSVWKS